MAIYSSSQSAADSKLNISKYRKIVSRKALTSPLWKNDKVILSIFNDRTKTLAYRLYEPKIDPLTNQVIQEKQLIPDHSPSVKLIQKALYLYFSEYTNKEGISFEHILNRNKFKGRRRLKNADFSNDFTEEISLYVKWFQHIHELTINEPDNDEPNDQEFFGYADRNVIAQLDIELEKIKYYSFFGQGKDGTFVKHNNSRCESFHFFSVAYKSIPELGNFEDTKGPNDPRIFMYSRPDKKANNRILQIDRYVTRIKGIQRGKFEGSNNTDQYLPGWVYVKIEKQGEIYYGYCDQDEIWVKSNLPETTATLRKIEMNEFVADIIKETYYTKVSPNVNLFKNDHDLYYPDNFADEDEEYYQFKFYVNLLLYVNNESGIKVPGDGEVIGLVFSNPPDIRNYHDKIEEINIFKDFDDNGSNYERFLKKLAENNNGLNWSWNGEGENSSNTLYLQGSSPNNDCYLWIPSRRFADTLYAYINRKASYLHQLAIGIRQKINDYWDPGYGFYVEGSLGATLGIPIHVEGGGSIYIYRKNLEIPDSNDTEKKPDIVIGIRKSGYVAVGAELSPGIGFKFGSVKSRSNKQGAMLGAQLYAEVSAGVRFHMESEYEFPLYVANSEIEMGANYDHATVALMVKFLGLFDTTGIVEKLALDFLETFTEFNIDMANYLTKMNMKFVGYARGSVGAFAGLKLVDSSNNTPYYKGSAQKSPYMVGQIIKRCYSQLSLSAEFQGIMGFEYAATYSDVCFDTGSVARVPKSYSYTFQTTAQALINGSADLGPFNLFNLSFEPYIGVKLTMEYLCGLGQHPEDPNKLDFYTVPVNGRPNPTSNQDELTFNANIAVPKVSFFVGDGNWDSYSGSATEFGVTFKMNQPQNWGHENIVQGVDYFYIKKRVALIEFEHAMAKNQTIHNQVKSFFNNGKKYKKFTYTCSAYIIFEVRIQPDLAGFLALGEKFGDIIDAIVTYYQNQSITLNVFTIFSKFIYEINPFNSGKVKMTVNDFFAQLTEIAEIQEVSFHTEVGGGFAGALKFTNITVSADFLALIVYHFQLFGEGKRYISENDENELMELFNTPLVKQSLIFFIL